MTALELKAKSIYPEISKSEQLAADYFIRNKDHIFKYPLASLAKMSGTSQGAWVRFCKSMGYDGLKGLKKALFDETSKSTAAVKKPEIRFTDVQDFASVSSIAENVCNSCIEAIHMTHRLFDEEIMEKAAQCIIRARSVKLFGISASGLVASDFCQKLLRIGYNVDYASDYHVALTYAATSTAQDAALLFSNSGETPEILQAADILKGNGTTVIGITKHTLNPLAQKCDYVLYMDSPEIYKRSGATSSRIAQLFLSDILFTTIANHDYANIEDNLEKSYSIIKTSAQKV